MVAMYNIINCFVTATLLILPTKGYNIDIDNGHMIKGSQERSEFGYSVELWKDKKNKIWAVIGAPSTRETLNKLDNETQPIGRVVLCSSAKSCKNLADIPTFKGKNNETLAIERYFQNEFVQSIGMGETIYVHKPSKQLLVCAPRYPGTVVIWSSLTNRGNCYLTKDGDSNTYKTLNPFKGNKFWVPDQNTYTPSLNAGMAALMTTKERIIISTPPVYFSRGAVYELYWDKGHTNKQFGRRKFGRRKLDKEYIQEGWAMAKGRFGGSRDSIAVSRQSRKTFIGEIVFYSTGRLRKEKIRSGITLEGEELGSRFGFAMASGDFDGDGTDDLAVAAPWKLVVKRQASHTTDHRMRDAGKVYIFYDPLKGSNERKSSIIEGTQSNGLFGYSIHCPGDLNQDGYDDLLIGAPYDGKKNLGKVYIFSGSKEGIETMPSQVIESDQLIKNEDPTTPKSLGFSIGGGIDIDSNGYPDIAIGAKESDTAYVLRSAPVYHLNIQASFNNSAELVYLGNKNCTLNSTKVACFDMSLEVQFVSSQKELRDEKIAVSISVNLDFTQTESRLLFNATSKRTFSFRRNISNSAKGPDVFNLPVVILHGAISLENSIQAKVEVKPNSKQMDLKEKMKTKTIDRGFESPFILPILKKSSPTSVEAKSIRIICEDKDTCFSNPDLKIALHPIPDLVIGQKSPLAINVTVETSNETAYNVQVMLKLPKLFKFEASDVFSNHVIKCQTPDEGEQEEAEFDVTCSFSSSDNYLKVGTKLELSFLLSHKALEKLENIRGKNSFDFNFSVKSDSKDLNDTNNNGTATVNTKIVTDCYVTSEIDPENAVIWVNYSKSDDQVMQLLLGQRPTIAKDLYIGPTIMHKFSLENLGPSPIIDAKINIYWPAYIKYPDKDLPITLFHSDAITNEFVTCVEMPQKLLLKQINGNESQSSDNSSKIVTRSIRREIPQIKKQSREITKSVGLNCESAYVTCFQIECNIPILLDGETATVEIEAVAITAVLQKLSETNSNSMVFSSVFDVYSKSSIKEKKTASTLFTIQSPKKTLKKQFSEQWMIVAGCILAGLFIIIILSAILYKCGFFKRKKVVRPPARALSYRNSKVDCPTYVLENSNISESNLRPETERMLS